MDTDKRTFLATLATLGSAGMAAAAAAAVPQTDRETAAAPHDTVFDVRAFGAKGDGKTPDTNAIQAAIDAAAAVHGTVRFPAGHYCCHALKARPHVTLLGDPAWIFRGDKAGASLILDDTGDQTDCLIDITGAFGVRLRGLQLCGDLSKKSGKTIHGIFLNNRERFSPKEDTIVVDDCKIQNFSGHGIYLLRIWLFIIRHSQCYGNNGSGVQIYGWDGFVTDNQFSGNGGHGFGCETCGATVMFTANRVEWNHGYGLSLCQGDAWNVTGNSFDRNWGAGLCATNLVASTVTGNLFRRCGKDAALLAEGEQSCHLRLESCRGLSVTGNTFKAGQDDGGKGVFTPQVGFIIRDLACCVISGNTLFKGYMNTLCVDKGQHGNDLVLKDNVGCPMT